MNYYRMYQNMGMHRNVSPLAVIKGEWKKIINWDLDKIGCLTKRKGYKQKLNVPDASEVLSLIPFEMGNIKKLIMINKAGKLYVADPVTDSTWGTAKLTGLSTTARWGYTRLHDSSGTGYMILGNGVDVYKTSDANTFTTVSGAPKAPYWATFQERVYAAGVSADKDVLHYSSIGDLTDWSSVSPSDSGSINIDKFANGNIQGIRNLNDRIVIYKDTAMKRWDEEYLKSVMTSSGLNAPYSLAEVVGMAFSLDRDAIRLYDGNVPVEISNKIQDLIYGIDFSDTNTPRICGEVFKQKYYLSVGDIIDEDDNITSNTWIVYDYNKNAFSLYSLHDQATTITKLKCSDGIVRLFFGGLNGETWQMFSGDTDDNNEIEARLEGHEFYPEGTEIYIDPQEIIVSAKRGQEMSVKIKVNDNDSRQTIGNFKKLISKTKTNELGTNVLGLQLVITHSTKGTPIFYGFSLGYEKEGTKDMLA